MFRASPWITYEPSTDFRNIDQSPDNLTADFEEMDDIDMDAPQISTLREEETPPPQASPTRTTKFRVKLLVNESKDPVPSPGAISRRQVGGAHSEEEEEEEEEDQLIDDDDDMKPSLSTSRPSDSPSKRKPSAKRSRPRKGDSKRATEERVKEKPQLPSDVPINQDPPRAEGLEMAPSGDNLPAPSDAPLAKAPAKKRAAPRKAPGAPRSRKSPSKPIKLPLISAVEDAGAISEGYTGTAASSPVTVHHDAGSPEPENIPPPPVVPSAETFSLEFVPLPVYPLPNKPFPVQPPPKISTGFAPVIPLDRSGKKVRHWRTANREIRGIAGGRWFARSWVGEKESEYASAAAASAAAQKAAQASSEGDKQPSSAGLSLPKLSAVSISAPPSGKGAAKFKVPKAQSASSAGPSSRANSVVPDPHAVRAPTKMRTILAAPSSEAGDSDMAPPSLVA